MEGNKMDEKERYAIEWELSSKFLYENSSYKHLSMQIDGYKTVLEVGCGTGYSTLALLQKGHTVIAIEKNPCCIEKAKELILNAGFSMFDDVSNMEPNSACIIECDITEPKFFETLLPQLSFDIVACWNTGTYWDKEMFSSLLPKMFKYGLTPEQIQANPESSYCELVIWTACSVAMNKNCAIHIVERTAQRTTKLNDQYYSVLKREFGFKNIKYQNLKSVTLSLGGRQLIVNGQINNHKKLPIIFISVLMK